MDAVIESLRALWSGSVSEERFASMCAASLERIYASGSGHGQGQDQDQGQRAEEQALRDVLFFASSPSQIRHFFRIATAEERWAYAQVLRNPRP